MTTLEDAVLRRYRLACQDVEDGERNRMHSILPAADIADALLLCLRAGGVPETLIVQAWEHGRRDARVFGRAPREEPPVRPGAMCEPARPRPADPLQAGLFAEALP
jgi:hypothetical protein